MKKLLSFFLAMLLIVCLSGCQTHTNGPPNNEDSSRESQSDELESRPEAGYPAPDFAAKDYGGREFNVYYQYGANFQYDASSYEIFEGFTSLDHALYNRDRELETKYNLYLNYVPEESATAYFQNALLFVLSGEGDRAYDMLYPNLENGSKLANSGALRDLSTMDNMDFKAPWWYGYFIDSAKIGGKIFQAPSHTNISMVASMMCVIFNKNLAEEYGMDNVYDLVRDGNWTMEKMIEYGRIATADLDGDTSAIGIEDRAGIFGNAMSIDALLLGQGLDMITVDEDGYPAFSIDVEGHGAIIDRVLTAFGSDCSLLAQRVYPDNAQANAFFMQYFMGGENLFWITAASAATNCKALEFDYGLLPLPKADEVQPTYISYNHVYNAATVCIPVNCPDTDLASKLAEEQAYLSQLNVRDEYYSTMLKYNTMRDPESGEMLDKISEGCVYSYVNVMRGDIAYMGALRSAVIKGEVNLSSMLEKNEETWSNTLQSIIDIYLNLE